MKIVTNAFNEQVVGGTVAFEVLNKDAKKKEIGYISVQVDKITFGKINRLAQSNSINRSELVRQMIEHCLKNMAPKENTDGK